MDKPIEKDENNGAAIYGSLTEGSTFGTLNTSAKEVAKAAARVVELLAPKTGVLPDATFVAAATYYDKTSPHGALLAKAIVNTVARVGENDISRQPQYLETSIHGEMLAMSEARHVLSVAEGRSGPLGPSHYCANARIVKRHPELKAGVQLQAEGRHYEMNTLDRQEAEEDVMHNYHSPRDVKKWAQMEENEGKLNYHLSGGRPENDLDFLEAKSEGDMSRVHNLLIYSKVTGNPDIDRAIRAVHSQISAPGSTFRRANPEMSETDFDLVQHQEMKAGARVLSLAETGVEFTPRQAAAFMLNDMATMHTCGKENGPALLYMKKMQPDDRQNIIHGNYGKLSADAKITIHSHLAHQHCVSPGLYQGVCQSMENPLTRGEQMVMNLKVQLERAAQQGQIGR